MNTYRIAAIPGDGIGPEVIGAGLTVLRALEQREGSFRLDVTNFDWGSDTYRRTGLMMPADGLDQIREVDAIFSSRSTAPPSTSPAAASPTPSAPSGRRCRCSITWARLRPPRG